MSDAIALRQAELEQAIFSNSQSLLQEALSDGANPNQRIALNPERRKDLSGLDSRLTRLLAEENRVSPLMLAAALGERENCRSLVSHGSARYSVSAWGWVPAQYAARLGYPELAASLIASDPQAVHYRISVRIQSQIVVLYRDDLPVAQGEISTGKPGYDTPPGRYLVTDKERTRKSSLYKVSMPYFLRLSFSEFGIHQGINPGRPASHGCIRVGQESLAKTLFEQTPIGTLVTVE